MRQQQGDSSDLGRFSEPALMILISLSDGPKHGYAIQADIEALTGVRPGPGTLYGAITRLEERGLIERLQVEERRNPYRLTSAGLKALRTQLSAIEDLARVARRRLAHA